MMSPGRRVIAFDIVAMRVGIGKMSCDVRPSCKKHKKQMVFWYTTEGIWQDSHKQADDTVPSARVQAPRHHCMALRGLCQPEHRSLHGHHTCRGSSLIQHRSCRSWPSISDAGTIQGPIGQKVSQLFPMNHCTQAEVWHKREWNQSS